MSESELITYIQSYVFDLPRVGERRLEVRGEPEKQMFFWLVLRHRPPFNPFDGGVHSMHYLEKWMGGEKEDVVKFIELARHLTLVNVFRPEDLYEDRVSIKDAYERGYSFWLSTPQGWIPQEWHLRAM